MPLFGRVILILLLGIMGFVEPVKAQRPDALEAAQVAMTDFSKHLNAVRKEGDSELAVYVSDLSNYTIGIDDRGRQVVVVFILKKTEPPVLGGGGEYWIEKSSLKIVRFKGYE